MRPARFLATRASRPTLSNRACRLYTCTKSRRKRCRVKAVRGIGMPAVCAGHDSCPQWSDMLTPWECPGIFADDAPFAGHAKRQRSAFGNRAEDGSATWCAPPIVVSPAIRLRGCSPRGRRFQTDLFDAVASASGSMWYPNFAEYVEAGEFERPLRCAYFSLGSKEARTPSRLLRGVADGTQRVVVAPRGERRPNCFRKQSGQPFQRARCAHGEGDLLGGFELRRGFAIEFEGVRS